MIQTEKISDRMLLVLGKNNGRFPYSHSILILDTDVVLIDTGCGIDTLKQLVNRYDIDYIINSHTHPDHSAGNWLFKGKEILVPKEGFNTSGNAAALSKRFVNEELATTWQRFAKSDIGFRDCRPTSNFNEETVLNFGRITLDPIYTPGHTKDHYCFFNNRKKILLASDYDLTKFPWYGHRESNIQEFRESVKKLMTLSSSIVISSHKGIITDDIHGKFEEYLRLIDERDEKILRLLRKEKTLEQLIEKMPIYGRFPYAEPLLQYWEGEMIKKHLVRMKKVQKIKSREDNTYIHV
ncbi:MAG: MBL fold metallo-hydrolase [Candidatus Bathyarchaeota archaeon]